jgi:hypothetical protein
MTALILPNLQEKRLYLPAIALVGHTDVTLTT